MGGANQEGLSEVFMTKAFKETLPGLAYLSPQHSP
jgi:hypothetical protein